MAIVDAEIEGPVTGKPVLNGNTVTMVVIGVSVTVPRLTADPDFPDAANVQMRTPISTPKRLITLEGLDDGTKFIGRVQDGYAGATAIVAGKYDTANDKMVLTATSVEIEPAENLLLGAVTAINPTAANQANLTVKGTNVPVKGQLSINGVPVKLVDDARMRFDGYQNEFGFFVELADSLVGTMASAEGYFVDGTFYAHTVEVDASAPVIPGQPSVSLTRVRTRSRAGGPATVDIRGGVDFNAFPMLGNTFTVQIRRVERDPITLVENQPDILIGIEEATRDAAFPRFGLWRLKGPLAQPPAGQLLGEPFPLTAPRMVRVQPSLPGVNPPQGGKAEEEADVRF